MWNRFGPLFAGDIRRQRVSAMRGFRHWRWHLDEMHVKLNGEMVYLWRAVDQEKVCDALGQPVAGNLISQALEILAAQRDLLQDDERL